ncbi:MAG: ABC transporter ATP-binding protein [Kiritimatiellia bacterium]|jgi:iron(III) transport system ATP-binding protein
MAVSVSINHLIKDFGDFRAVNDVCLDIRPGEIFFLLGPSGCGKTTLLRCVAGFHAPDGGTIAFDGRDITQTPPHQRDTGMVFQSYALWPHMTIAQNVAFGLEMRKVPRDEIRRRVKTVLEHVRIADRANSKPNQLSGGQQQRVALARALVIEPKCLLLDEPLSNLDAKLRLEMRIEIRRICKEAGLTALYVTHDQKEALAIADRLAVMRDGVIEQVGGPAEVYRTPRNRFVAGFIGEANFLEGHLRSLSGDRAAVETPMGVFETRPPATSVESGSPAAVCVRPEGLTLLPADTGQQGNVLKGRIVQSVYQGEIAQHVVAVDVPGGAPLELKVCELAPVAGSSERTGASVSLHFAPDQAIAVC